MLQKLRQKINGLPSTVRTDLPEFVRRNRIQVAVAGALLLAAMVTLLLWSGESETDLRPLYGRQEMYDVAAVIETLDANGIAYRLHPESGQVLVRDSLHRSARMSLATAGVTAKMPRGMELLSTEGQLGRSQFVERTQYMQGLEGELAQTVMSLRPVRSARVHLAVPERTAFLRNQVEPSASVYVDLFPGVSLEIEQVQGIINLVAGSLPQLSAERVTVLDQNSNPLYGSDHSGQKEVDRQLRYVQRIEQEYVQRLSRLIEPLVGAGNLRVAVNADIDFSFQEDSVEGYDPEVVVLRSESFNGSNEGAQNAEGVPGAAANLGNEETEAQEGGSSVSRIRNYELNRTLSYRRQDAFRLERVNVAVILNSRIPGFEGDAADGMLMAIDNLLRNAVGIDSGRGDQVTVEALPFFDSSAGEEPLMGIAGIADRYSENDGILPVVIVVAVLILLLLAGLAAFLVVRRRRAQREKVEMEKELALLDASDGLLEEGGEDPDDVVGFRSSDRVRDLAKSSPDQIASILERWMKEGE